MRRHEPVEQRFRRSKIECWRRAYLTITHHRKFVCWLSYCPSSSNYDTCAPPHRSEPSSLHVEDVVVARAVFAALLRYHHELLSTSFEVKPVLRIQAVHPRALRDGMDSQGGAGGGGARIMCWCWSETEPYGAHLVDMPLRIYTVVTRCSRCAFAHLEDCGASLCSITIPACR